MKNNEIKPVKQPKNKQKTIALAFGTALAFCSILAPFSAYSANADVVDNGHIIEEYIPNDYLRHPLGGFSLSCCNPATEKVEVFDCPATYGGNATYFGGNNDFVQYTAWQNTTNGTFHVESTSSMTVNSDSVIFQLVGLNVALVDEHINTNGWSIGTGQYQYDVEIFAYPILSTGETSPDFVHYIVTPNYRYDEQYQFYWNEIFEDMPDEIYANNGTALFDVVWISFTMSTNRTYTPVLSFFNTSNYSDIYQWDYASRIRSLYAWIYNGSPIQTIMKFPIDFLRTEIFPNFSFGTMLLIALGVLVFGLGLKIAFGG